MRNIPQEFDIKAKGLAADYLRTEGLLLTLLMEMRKRKMFAPLNYSGIFDYCESGLKLSRAQAFYFKSVAEKSEEVPEIKEAIVQGELTLSQARRIVPVVTSENKSHWIEKAKTLSQKELEREVTVINPKAHITERIKPVAPELSELKVAVDARTEENLNALREILSQKLGKAASLTDVISWAAQITRDKFDPMRKARRAMDRACISSRKCEADRAMPQPVSSSEGGLDRAGISSRKLDAERPIEQAISSRKCEVKRRPIPAGVMHPVMLRDGNQCAYVGPDGRRCGQTRWLDFHHIKPVAQGGLNTVSNLRLLCKGHHELMHANGSRRNSHHGYPSKEGRCFRQPITRESDPTQTRIPLERQTSTPAPNT